MAFHLFSSQTNLELRKPHIISPEDLTVLTVEEYNDIREKYKEYFFR
jgi:hypothetical protein